MKTEGIQDKEQHISDSAGEWVMSHSNNSFFDNDIDDSEGSMNEFLEGTFFG